MLRFPGMKLQTVMLHFPGVLRQLGMLHLSKMLLQPGMPHDPWVPSGWGEAGQLPHCPPQLTLLLSPLSPVDFIGGFDSYGYQAPQKTSHLQLQPLYT